MSDEIIKLTRYYNPDLAANKHVWPLTISASSEGDISSAIFVYQVSGQGDPYSGFIFNKIASVNDLSEIPELKTATIDNEFQIPFFRTSVLELHCRNPEEADEIFNAVIDDTKDLIRNYNASLKLNSSEIVSVTESGATSEPFNSSIIALSYHPAGTATVTDGNQNISSPDDSIKGWLPVSEVPVEFTDPVPVGAKFFYNVSQHPEFAELLPVLTPYNLNTLFYNGVQIPYGTVFKLTSDTIYWMDFTSDDFDFFTEGNAPWPLDYISPEFAGNNVPEIRLLVLKENV